MTDSVLKIVAPWITRENEEKEADQKKLSELFNILSPQDVSFWCRFVWNGYYQPEFNSKLDDYLLFINQPQNFFFRRKLKKKYKSFNKNFLYLRSFLFKYFFTNPNNPSFVELNPELNHTDNNLYVQKLEELRTLTSNFQNTYNDLIVTSREKYISTFTLIISLLLLITLVTPGFIWIVQKIKLKFFYSINSVSFVSFSKNGIATRVHS